jgi:pimeloyl-ACP methyl ester carboxylesterase
MRLLAACCAAGLLLASCSTGDTTREAAPKASGVPAPPPPEPPKAPPLTAEPATFETADKIPLSGTLYLSKDEASPILILVHRFRGDRSEWDGLAKRLAEAKRRYTVLAFDLRGHGESKSSSGKRRVDWADMGPKDVPLFVEDVHAATRFALERTQGKATRVVLVGSSLGGAIAARAASEDSHVVAVGLVSPGAQIEGFDVYHPFADVRMLPAFLAGAKDDNVSREPIDGLSRMAKDLATVKSYEGRGHGAFGLAAEGPALFTDLETWLDGVYDKEPVEREIKASKADGKKLVKPEAKKPEAKQDKG